MTNSIGDLGTADVVLVIGSNTTEAHPIIGIELKRAARKGTRIFVADPREVALIRHAERWLPVKPGANVALLNAMMRVILDEDLADEDFIADRTEGFDELREMLDALDLEDAARTAGVPLAAIRETALAYAVAEKAAIVYSMGVTQHTSGTEQVRAVANLAMLTGNIGRPGTGVNPLRGQNNVQGACDAGCLPDLLPGYRSVASASAREALAKAWGAAVPATPGLTSVEMLDGAVSGTIKAMYIVGENPVVTDPDESHVLQALGALDFLVVQDLFLTETARLADVVLPAASWLEKDGTFTNTERRVQRVRTVVEAPDGALTDSEILGRLAEAMGRPLGDISPAALLREMATVAVQYGGVTHERLDAEGSLQWPCPTPGHPGTPILHAGAFARGRGAFAAVAHREIAQTSAPRHPFVLTTGRDLWHYHGDSMTGRSGELAELAPNSYVAMHPEDARDLGLQAGDRVEVTSDVGSVATTLRVGGGSAVRRGVVYMPFHFADAPANRVTGGALDPTSKIAPLKATRVSVTPAA